MGRYKVLLNSLNVIILTSQNRNNLLIIEG